VRRPNPGSGKQHDRVNGVIAFHFLECGPSLFFAGDHDAVLNDVKTRRNQCTLGALHQCVINEWRTHWVF
jgi:hypothetical protein